MTVWCLLAYQSSGWPSGSPGVTNACTESMGIRLFSALLILTPKLLLCGASVPSFSFPYNPDVLTMHSFGPLFSSSPLPLHLSIYPASWPSPRSVCYCLSLFWTLSDRCLRLYSPLYLQLKPSPQPYPGAAMLSVYIVPSCLSLPSTY